MTVGRVNDFDFSSAGKTVGLCKGGMAKPHYAKGGAVKAKSGPVVEKSTGERYPSREAMVKHEAKETPRMQREEMTQRSKVTLPARKSVPVASKSPLLALKKGGPVRKADGALQAAQPQVLNPKQSVWQRGAQPALAAQQQRQQLASAKATTAMTANRSQNQGSGLTSADPNRNLSPAVKQQLQQNRMTQIAQAEAMNEKVGYQPRVSMPAQAQAAQPKMNAMQNSDMAQSNTMAQLRAQPGAMKKGGLAQAKVGKVMGEFKSGELHSGSKKGPVVSNPKQAIAIAMSEARRAGKK